MENKYQFKNVQVIDGKVTGRVILRSFQIAGGKIPKGKALKVPKGREMDFDGVELKQVMIYALNHWLVQVGKLRTKELEEVGRLLDKQVFGWGFAENPTIEEETQEDKVKTNITKMVATMIQNKVAKAAIVGTINGVYGKEFNKESLDAYINAEDREDNKPKEVAVLKDK